MIQEKTRQPSIMPIFSVSEAQQETAWLFPIERLAKAVLTKEE